MVMEEAQRWAGCWKKEVGIKLPVELSSKAKEVQVKKASASVNCLSRSLETPEGWANVEKW